MLNRPLESQALFDRQAFKIAPKPLSELIGRQYLLVQGGEELAFAIEFLCPSCLEVGK